MKQVIIALSLVLMIVGSCLTLIGLYQASPGWVYIKMGLLMFCLPMLSGAVWFFIYRLPDEAEEMSKCKIGIFIGKLGSMFCILFAGAVSLSAYIYILIFQGTIYSDKKYLIDSIGIAALIMLGIGMVSTGNQCIRDMLKQPENG